MAGRAAGEAPGQGRGGGAGQQDGAGCLRAPDQGWRIQKARVGGRNGADSLTEGEGIELPARETAARRKDQGANDDDDPTGRVPDERQADYTNAPSRAYRCLAAHDADFIEASGQMRRTERPDIWAHCLPEGKVSSRALAQRGRSTYVITPSEGKTQWQVSYAARTCNATTIGDICDLFDP